MGKWNIIIHTHRTKEQNSVFTENYDLQRDLRFMKPKNKTFLFDVLYRRWGRGGYQKSEFLCLGKRLPAGLLRGGTCHWKSSER